MGFTKKKKKEKERKSRRKKGEEKMDDMTGKMLMTAETWNFRGAQVCI